MTGCCSLLFLFLRSVINLASRSTALQVFPPGFRLIIKSLIQKIQIFKALYTRQPKTLITLILFDVSPICNNKLPVTSEMNLTVFHRMILNTIVQQNSHKMLQIQPPEEIIILCHVKKRFHQKFVHPWLRTNRNTEQQKIHHRFKVILITDQYRLCTWHQVAQEGELVCQHLINGLVTQAVSFEVGATSVVKVFFYAEII